MMVMDGIQGFLPQEEEEKGSATETEVNQMPSSKEHSVQIPLDPTTSLSGNLILQMTRKV